ncbi:MAG TPA: TonB-dependent receptor plug domain-containing protein, partial [Rhodocyclaceae bacterium]|nr:TonB-dependent receptor plug domain-containing protein [Rhodocyclaceae bacterium]
MSQRQSRPSFGFAAAALCLAAAFARADSGALALDLPAQDLGDAMRLLAQKANVQVLFAADLVKNKRAPALKGSYTPEAALRALLAGSGLEARARGDGTFALVAAQPAAEGPARTLAEISVVATKTRNTVDTTPASVSVAGQERFEEMQAATIQPVVRAMPNVEMGGGPRVDGLVPTIRGAYGASVTLLLDGARQDDLMAVGMKSPLYADPYFLKQVEVLRGASSS